jgi:hypothetical protein
MEQLQLHGVLPSSRGGDKATVKRTAPQWQFALYVCFSVDADISRWLVVYFVKKIGPLLFIALRGYLYKNSAVKDDATRCVYAVDH